ncbi:hypothetical protein [Nocardiopsis sp. CNR-923]|nr:hypothetical protein [Nocardiopsis sp. CNR-923]
MTLRLGRDLPSGLDRKDEVRFRLGPLEWVSRSLTYLRPMPMRR